VVALKATLGKSTLTPFSVVGVGGDESARAAWARESDLDDSRARPDQPQAPAQTQAPAQSPVTGPLADARTVDQFARQTVIEEAEAQHDEIIVHVDIRIGLHRAERSQ